jgi:MFS transporter, Spinster family, sphingosine-1-phosphate transporter
VIKSRGVIVGLLTGLNFLNYLDRLIVASLVPTLKLPVAAGGLGLSNTEAGFLATAFLLGYFLTSPLFGWLADRGPRKGLIAGGVLVWSAATVASGLAGAFLAMVAARAICGVGEASYATLAPTIIDDITPPEKKGKVLAIFYAAMPIGAAAGFMLGGFIDAHWGWRTAFFVAGAPGAILAITCLFIAEPVRKLRPRGTKTTTALSTLVRIPLYRRAVIGYCAHTAAVGAFSYWAPTYLHERYDLPTKTGSFWFGLVTVAAGFIGTLIGGRWADKVNANESVAPDAPHHDPANRRAVNNLLKICAIGVALAAPLCFAALLSPVAWPFFVIGFFVELGLFVGTSPINAALLRGVPVELRASSMAIAIFAIHLFGDLWSPTVLGGIADATGSMLIAMMALPFAVALAGYVWWPRAREAAP